jgi:xylulose-5-phosphate/fructose-6-phosphate phosphoketolase
MPDFRDYAISVDKPGQVTADNTRPLGRFLCDILRQNGQNFRVFSPDENTSNRLDAVYEASKKLWLADYLPKDAEGGELSPNGRVLEMLSEHTLEGWAGPIPAWVLRVERAYASSGEHEDRGQ